MIKPAEYYKDEINKKRRDICYEEKYKYYFSDVYVENLKFENDSDWESRTFASVDKNNELIGYIGYRINRVTNNVYGLHVINFTDNIMFGLDFMSVFKDIFEKFKFNKISFEVVIGNPIEKQYDRMVKKYNGRIIGIKKQEVKCYDGEYYDLKMYEILRSEYLESKRNKNAKK